MTVPLILKKKIIKRRIKNPPREKIRIFQEMETSKKRLIFSQKKAILMFREKVTPKEKLSKASYVSGGNLQSPKNKQKSLL